MRRKITMYVTLIIHLCHACDSLIIDFLSSNNAMLSCMSFFEDSFYVYKKSIELTLYKP